MILYSLTFYLFSSVAVLSALMVISAKNPVHSVLFLILSFVNASGLFVLLGAEFFNSFIALTQLPNQLGEIAVKNNLSPFLIVACILILYLFLGCLMDSLAMILLTISVFFPLIINYSTKIYILY